MTITDYIPPIACAIAPNIGGIINGYITRQNIESWYKNLKKPSWTAPNWVFAPVWTTIYSSLGYASYLVVTSATTTRDLIVPMTLLGTNLILNYTWTPIFFSYHRIKWAFYNVALLWGCTALLVPEYFRVNVKAGLLVTPYLAWGTYAMMLNFSIMKLNPSEEKQFKELKDN